MGSRGPAPQPLALVQQSGNAGHHSKAELEARAAAPDPGGVPKPPTWLDREAKAEWKRIAGRLDRAGMLSSVDRGLLAAWCECWSTFHAATKALRGKGGQQIVNASERGATLHPAFRAKMQAATQLKALAAELGLSYASRARMSEPTSRLDEEDGGPADGGLGSMLG
jgi:P27 family predicted phage terminase small subunit